MVAPPIKDEPPINDRFWIRALTIIAVYVSTWRYLRWFWKHPGNGILFVWGFCIKIRGTHFASLSEAHTMRFVAQHTSIPVPKVYCAFEWRGKAYTVMERIDGKMAACGWVYRSEESKRKVLAQLESLIQQLHAVEPPDGGGVSNILGGPIYDARLHGEGFRGPFSDIKGFHRSLTNGMNLSNHTFVSTENHPDLATEMKQLGEFHDREFSRPILTHGDLSSLNVLVRGDEVVGIIDWETAGWYPPYWEYTTASYVNPYNEFWREEIDKFLKPLPYELEMENIRRQYFGDF
ncbi:kinase-like domain-containing protein [Camillea tinctor]|nr:kinase-like domain-containing protein [Camillea tinctor]